MKFSLRFLMVLAGAFLAFNHGKAQTTNSYLQEIEQWDSSRIHYLKSEEGWLNLEGLFWLKEGKSSFGSNPSSQLVFPGNILPADAGYFERQGNTVRLFPTEQTSILVNGQVMKDAVVYNKDLAPAPVMTYGSLRWTIIQREDKIGIRLRNLNSKHLREFRGIERFAVDPAWKVDARLERGNPFQTVSITNVLGQTTEQRSPRKLVFTLKGKQYTLDALEEGDQLFIIFGDQTSGETTYPSGRYMYARKPGPEGITTLDFNKAYNPPCAFTPHATCPIPPPQNILPLEVIAGEKNYH